MWRCSAEGMEGGDAVYELSLGRFDVLFKSFCNFLNNLFFDILN